MTVPPAQPPMQPQQPMPPTGTGQFPGQHSAGLVGAPIRVRYNPTFGAIMIAIGVLNVVLAIANDFTIGWFPGIVFTILGVLYCVGTALEVDQQSARVKSPAQITMKTVPLHGIGDLVFEGKVLFRAGDHRKIVNLGWGSVRPEDLQRLQAAIAQARGGWSPARGW